MSRPSFIGILLLTIGLAIVGSLVIWHHLWLTDLEQSVMQQRLDLKLLSSREPVPADEAPMTRTLPEIKPAPLPKGEAPVPRTRPETKSAPSGPERFSDLTIGQKVIEPPQPKATAPVRPRPKSAPPKPVDEFEGLDNWAIDAECQRRGLLTNMLPDRWRCLEDKTK